MNNEYIIINKTTIQKRIEDWENKYGNEDVESSSKAFILMKEILSQSTPLIPEIEKAFDAGKDYGYDLGESNYIGCNRDTTIFDKQDYISNLKLDI